MTKLKQLEQAQAAVTAARLQMRHWVHDEECGFDEERPEEPCTCGLALVQRHLKTAVEILQAFIVLEREDNGHPNG